MDQRQQSRFAARFGVMIHAPELASSRASRWESYESSRFETPPRSLQGTLNLLRL
jgi:hypothetical protein